MSASGPKTLPTLGFLTVVDLGEPGLVGGYLALNAAGRPLEFHCTAPVRANRAQEILYGPTLKPFLYGEQIGQTLLNKSSVEPLFIMTDVEPVLAVREFTRCPVVWLRPADGEVADKSREERRESSRRWDSAQAAVPAPHRSFLLGRCQAVLPRGHEADGEELARTWQPFQDYLDLCEPFTRIREAIEETQRTGRGS